jgi:hypothetical protein
MDNNNKRKDTTKGVLTKNKFCREQARSFRHPTRHNKSKCFSLDGQKCLSFFQISISSSKEFKEFVSAEAQKRKISVSKLLRDSVKYTVENNII